MKAEFVWIKGSKWKSADGLSTKTTLAELQKINGKPFEISGFGWEFSGFCNFEGGKMPENLSVYLEPQSQKVSTDFYGDVAIRSDNKRLSSVKPKISRIAMALSPWED